MFFCCCSTINLIESSLALVIKTIARLSHKKKQKNKKNEFFKYFFWSVYFLCHSYFLFFSLTDQVLAFGEHTPHSLQRFTFIIIFLPYSYNIFFVCYFGLSSFCIITYLFVVVERKASIKKDKKN